MGWRFLVASFGAEEFRRGVERLPLFDAALYPDLAEALVLPIGEQADAVGAGFDGVEVVFHRARRRDFRRRIGASEGGLDVEGDFGDYAERAEADDCALERVGVLLAGQFDDVAGGSDEFQGGDGGGEVAVFFAGAVGGGGAGSGDGDVRQRGEIVEREAFGVEKRGELAVGDAGIDGDGAGLGIERDDFVERLQREEACLLSAMLLKQWREPRTFSLVCFLTNFWA